MALQDDFSTTYTEARQKFLAAAEAAGARVDSLPLTASGPDKQPLYIDIARLGSAAPKSLLIHVSGIHGVEGFAGSAIQSALLHQPPTLPAATALVLVHLLNPYGAAWLRRTNESNIDLNRNYMLPGQPWAGTPEVYHRLNAFLNPPRPPRRNGYLLQCLCHIARHGFATMKRAVASGQYDYPQGLFYGGRAPEQSYRLYRDWLRRSFPAAERLFVIDVHTGLGPSGVGSLCHEAVGTPSADIERHLDRPFVIKDTDSDVIGYRPSGPHRNLYLELYPEARVDVVTQEFGTTHSLRVLKALRAENQLHQHGDCADLAHWAKRDLLEAFVPDSAVWRQQVVSQGLRLVEASIHLFP